MYVFCTCESAVSTTREGRTLPFRHAKRVGSLGRMGGVSTMAMRPTARPMSTSTGSCFFWVCLLLLVLGGGGVGDGVGNDVRERSGGSVCMCHRKSGRHTHTHTKGDSLHFTSLRSPSCGGRRGAAPCGSPPRRRACGPPVHTPQEKVCVRIGFMCVTHPTFT